MLHRIEVSSYLDATSLPIGEGATNDPIQIRDISGLGPVKADLMATAFATGRGSYYQGGSIPERNIVLTLGLNPYWTGDSTVAGLRKLLYGYFMPEQPCKLRFFTDDYPNLQIEGICESVEPNIFSQDPEIQVSIINHQPDFLEIDGVEFEGVVTNAITDGIPEEYEFNYEGTAPTGFVMIVKPTDDATTYTGPLWIVLETSDTLNTFILDEVTIDVSHHVIFGSLDNDRKIQQIDFDAEPDAYNDLLKNVEQGSVWHKFMPGSNILAVSAEENGLEFQLTYFTRYGGI